jgi:cytochrome c biogenesis protein
VPFLGRDGNQTSLGVVKVTGTSPQLGFDGFFLPTAVIDQDGPHSVYPGLELPRALLSVWTGDLGVDGGTPQSVYSLDKDGLTQVRGENGRKLVVGLAPGTTVTLPTGESITMDGVRRWTSLSIARDPGAGPALGSALLALAGLMLSLFIRRRRVWVRASTDEAGRTLVEVAGLARTEGEGGDTLVEEVRELAGALGTTHDGDDTTGEHL